MKTLVVLLALLLHFPAAAMGQSFPEFLRTLSAEPDSAARSKLADAFLRSVNAPVVGEGNVTFLYAGDAQAAAAPSELSQWDPSRAPMTRVPGTRLFYRQESVPPDGRLEYKLWADSVWMLDPLNPRRAGGGYGENSDVWMPGYVQSLAARRSPNVKRGRIDTLTVASASLGRAHSVYVYTPAAAAPRGPRPVLYVTDGGDYLAHGRLDVILDNLIAARSIEPVVAVFLEPRSSGPGGPADHRMTEYAASDAFVDFLEHELAPMIEERYHGSGLAERRVILGASMGGLQATYAVLKRPGFVSNCAAQSPAYRQADGAVIALAGTLDARGRYFYIDAGTIGDTEEEATLVAGALRRRGADVMFRTHHEGHNWTNWRARLPAILKTFFPRK